jgi:sialic acid synthase SpsE
MKIGDFDTDQRVLVIAEIGNNHEGSLAEAKNLIQAAAEAGADAVKFQTFHPNLYVSSDQSERLAKLRKFELPQGDWIQLAELSDKLGILFFSTPFDLVSAENLNAIQKVFKISSGDNSFWPLIEKVASFGKPTLISTGISDLEHLRRLLSFWQKHSAPDHLALLHCVASYPTPPHQAQLASIRILNQTFPTVTIGYSDHTLDIEAGPLAVAAGARIVEKHFTLDKKRSDFRDHQISADPSEMRNLVSRIRLAEALLGDGRLVVRDCEKDMQRAVRRSLAAARALPAGSVLSWQDLIWVRPGSGIPPGQEDLVIGKTLVFSKKQGELIFEKDLSAN